MGRIKEKQHEMKGKIFCLHNVFGGAMWSAFDRYSWVGFDALIWSPWVWVSPTLSLSLSLSLSLTLSLSLSFSLSIYRFSLNVQVGFLSCFAKLESIVRWWWGGAWCGWIGPTCPSISTLTHSGLGLLASFLFIFIFYGNFLAIWLLYSY